jgi:hypothetical protein
VQTPTIPAASTGPDPEAWYGPENKPVISFVDGKKQRVFAIRLGMSITKRWRKPVARFELHAVKMRETAPHRWQRSEVECRHSIHKGTRLARNLRICQIRP